MEDCEARTRLDEVESRMSSLEESVNRAVGTLMPKVDALLARRSEEEEEASSAARSATTASESTSLVELARRGDHEALLGLLANTVIDIRRNPHRDENGDTPLHVAARQGHVKATVVLVGIGAKVNAPGCHRRKPLHCAAAHGHLAVAQRLLMAGAQVDAKDADGATPLSLAAGRGSREIVNLLLQKGANPDDKVFSVVSENGHWHLVESLLQNGKLPPDQCNVDGVPLIVLAGRANRWDVVDMLLEKGASATKCKETKESALVLASEGGQADAVRELLRRGADKNKEQVDCALIKAKNAAVVWAFVDVVSEKVQGPSGKLGLVHAGCYNRLESMLAFLRAGVNVNATDGTNGTALWYAASNGRVACVRELLQHGADVNLKNNSGITPLHGASMNGHVECVRFLLDAGASSKEKNNDGNTPLHEASVKGHVECIRALLDAGARATERNNQGKTPLELAIFRCARLLLNGGQ